MPVVEYTWDPVTDSILEETDGAGNLLASYTNEPTLYGPLISQRRDGETHYFHFDALGSTRNLTNDVANVIDTFTYDAWGNEVQRSGTSQTAFQWTGRFGYYATSAVQGLYTIRRRRYATPDSLWDSKDPLPADLSTGAYLYGKNSPLIEVDPSGNDPDCHDCAPLDGVTHVPNRGQFNFIQLYYTSPIPADYQELSFAAEWWAYFDPSNPFLTGNDCCCCETIGFIQVARHQSQFEWYTWDSGWFLDVYYNKLSPRGPEYPLQKKGHPCKWDRSTRMTDDPLSAKPPIADLLGVNDMLAFRHSFEACVVCLKGCEGPRYRVHRPDPTAIYLSVKDIAVYGCVKWGGYTNFITGQRSTHVDGFRRNGFGGPPGRYDIIGPPVVGGGPSQTFIDTLQRHLYRFL